MDNVFEIFLKVLIVFIGGTIFLRLSGRKTISQMTIAETVMVITLGTILANPIASKMISNTLYSAGFFVLFFIINEIIQMKFNPLENLITGKAINVINNGELKVKNLTQLRLTVDQLEVRLREQGISSINHVKTATIEPNGKLGYELKQEYKPINEIELIRILNSLGIGNSAVKQPTDNIFTEVKQQVSNNTDPKLK